MIAEPEVVTGSFRDPHGFVFRHEALLYRQVNEAHRDHFDHFLRSGLYEALVSDGLLIPHEEVDGSIAVRPRAYRVLRPEQIPFVSYPYEWGFQMLRDAALATLEIQERALDHGMSLRDASAYNITFHRGRPVFVDTTSFEILPEGRPWFAYRQFCQHFLAPLALMSLGDIRLGQLTRLHIDGIPLDLAAKLLPARARTRPGLAMHILMHAKSQRRHERDGSTVPVKARSFSSNAFRGVLGSLRKAIDRLRRPTGTSPWREYYVEADHYSIEAAAQKESLVGEWIDEVRPRSVWDLGANTGRFARLASGRGIDALALDVDPFCVDQAYQTCRANGDEHLLPLVQDLTNPSNGIGWAGCERASLEERGPADLVLALALIHHLVIANNIPIPAFLAYLSRLSHSAIVEFVPKTDPKVQLLLRNREDIFLDYDLEHFEAEAKKLFRIKRRSPVGESGRTLFLLLDRT